MPKALSYSKPKITQKKIKISYFLSNVHWLDQFNLIGNVYAQSSCEGSPSCAESCGGAGCGCSCKGSCFGSSCSINGCGGGSANSGSGSCNSGG